MQGRETFEEEILAMMLSGGIDASLPKKKCLLSKELLLIPLSSYGNNAPCCQADQDFSKTPKTSKTSAALAALAPCL